MIGTTVVVVGGGVVVVGGDIRVQTVVEILGIVSAIGESPTYTRTSVVVVVVVKFKSAEESGSVVDVAMQIRGG